VKRVLFAAPFSLRRMLSIPTALKGDAWHHRSDAVTSGAAAIGIQSPLIGGKVGKWQTMGALAACSVIVTNAFRIVRASVYDARSRRFTASSRVDMYSCRKPSPGSDESRNCLIRKSSDWITSTIAVDERPARSFLIRHFLVRRTPGWVCGSCNISTRESCGDTARSVAS